MHSDTEPPLRFPRIVKETDPHGRPLSEEYDIPLNAKQQVLEQLYPFEGCPDLSEILYDLHEGRTFRVVDFKVVREHERNWLVSPYYYSSGGSVIDWVPPSFAEDEDG